jgi:hypothetical protein
MEEVSAVVDEAHKHKLRWWHTAQRPDRNSSWTDLRCRYASSTTGRRQRRNTRKTIISARCCAERTVRR